MVNNNPMSVSKFLKRKNEILKEYTGLTLIPENQIKDIEPMKLSASLNTSCCPYCQVYLIEYDDIACENCPMGKAGNECSSMNSTWFKVSDKLVDKHHLAVSRVPEIIALVDEYNKSHNF